MNSISVRNVNQALVEGIWLLRSFGSTEDSRNGPVLAMPGPMCTTYGQPRERVLFDAARDANPIFHLMEAIWMLAGSNKVEWLLPFNSTFGKYAEDDGRMHGAYGFRWREFHGFDQLDRLVQELENNPNSRRAVLGMWNPGTDLATDMRDVPCNTHIYFDLRGGLLNMSVCCRSNDAVMGAYGANVVHFSMLQEMLAHALGAPVGVYRQISNNFHLYTEEPKSAKLLAHTPANCEYDPYSAGDVHPYPLLTEGEGWRSFLSDCEALVRGERNFLTNFFLDVALPLHDAYLLRKEKDPLWRTRLEDAEPSDWKLSFQQWTDRRADPAHIKGEQA